MSNLTTKLKDLASEWDGKVDSMEGAAYALAAADIRELLEEWPSEGPAAPLNDREARLAERLERLERILAGDLEVALVRVFNLAPVGRLELWCPCGFRYFAGNYSGDGLSSAINLACMWKEHKLTCPRRIDRAPYPGKGEPIDQGAL